MQGRSEDFGITEVMCLGPLINPTQTPQNKKPKQQQQRRVSKDFYLRFPSFIYSVTVQLYFCRCYFPNMKVLY